jgi:hypothetical protein
MDSHFWYGYFDSQLGKRGTKNLNDFKARLLREATANRVSKNGPGLRKDCIFVLPSNI